ATILIDVAGRNFLSAPLRGTQNLVQVALIVIIFGSVAMVDRQDANVAVDLLEPQFSPGFNRVLTAVGRLIGALIFFGIAWTMVDSATISRMLNLSTNILNIPKAPFQYVIAAFSVLAGITMVLRVILILLGRDRVLDTLPGDL
ncbi:MAG: TRAP transporter small permease, partial [Oceanisphaera sp.]|nr:TRAP transporter small permease [Oceanisphaera sp.]